MNRTEVFVGTAQTNFNEDGVSVDERTVGGVSRFTEAFAKWMDWMG